MLQLFKSREKQRISVTEDQVRQEIILRAQINSTARKEAVKIAKEKTVQSKKVVSKDDMLKTLDNVLNAVAAYENSKITALTELYLAIESGDTKNLIQFLKKKDAPIAKKKKLKKVWEL